MKKNKVYIIIITIAILIILSLILFIFNKDNKNDRRNNDTDIYEPIIDIYEDAEAKLKKEITEKLESLSLEEKIGQMLIITNPGPSYTDELKNIIETVKPGGFILMSDNYSTYDNTLTLVKSMQEISDIPMIIATDQEGGSVQRLKKLSSISVTDIPYMYYLGNTNDENLAYETGKIMALQMRSLGINLDFAPVVDVYSNPNNTVIGRRSFSSNVDTVIKMAFALKKGMEENLVNTCIKHFPGHGDTATDSHVALPIINKTIEELESLELKPFINSIKTTNMIMVGHIALPQITGDNTPASLSKVIINDLLKEKYGFEGLVITDALNMGALKNNYTDKEIYVNAINAGVDILLMPNGAINTLNLIKEAVANKEVSEEQINNSVYKILMYKHNNIKENYLDSSYLNKEEYNSVINKFKN